MICKNCGANVAEDFAFCENCGAAISREERPAAPLRIKTWKKVTAMLIVAAALIAATVIVTITALNRTKTAEANAPETIEETANRFIEAYKLEGVAAYFDFLPESFIQRMALEKQMSVEELRETFRRKYLNRWSIPDLDASEAAEYVFAGAAAYPEKQTEDKAERWLLSETEELQAVYFKREVAEGEGGTKMIMMARIGSKWYIFPESADRFFISTIVTED